MTNNLLPPIDPKKETAKISAFIKKVLKKTSKENVVIGLSGGIDSTTALFLLCQTLDPKNIHVAHLSYFDGISNIDQILHQVNIPQKNIHHLSIKKAVDEAAKSLNLYSSSDPPTGGESRSYVISTNDSEERSQKDFSQAKPDRNDSIRSTRTINVEKIRFGNIMARMRMIYLYDLAKKYDALVCGTENRYEDILGYFTRYGDEASDFEPIKHLYKTHVYQLAEYFDVPAEIREQTPTAGLWLDQTDEKQLGFSYKEADQVLYLYFDKRQTLDEIKTHGFKNAEKIIGWAKNNQFKHEVPYVL